LAPAVTEFDAVTDLLEVAVPLLTSWADVTVTDGELDRAVNVPPDVDASEVGKEYLPLVDGAVTPDAPPPLP
jgi:hypothetical protein